MQQPDNLQNLKGITLDQLVNAYNSIDFLKIDYNKAVDSLKTKFSAAEGQVLVNVIQNIDFVNFYKLNNEDRANTLTVESLKSAIKTGQDAEGEQHYTNLRKSIQLLPAVLEAIKPVVLAEIKTIDKTFETLLTELQESFGQREKGILFGHAFGSGETAIVKYFERQGVNISKKNAVVKKIASTEREITRKNLQGLLNEIGYKTKDEVEAIKKYEQAKLDTPLPTRVANLETRVEQYKKDNVKGYVGQGNQTVQSKEAALKELQDIRKERKSLEEEVEDLKEGSKISEITEEALKGLKTGKSAVELKNEFSKGVDKRLERKGLGDKLVALKTGTQTSDIKTLQDELNRLEKEGAKALEKAQQDLFKEIIAQATVARVNEKLEAGMQKSTADIAKGVADKYVFEEGLKNSLTTKQQEELNKTLDALKRGEIKAVKPVAVSINESFVDDNSQQSLLEVGVVQKPAEPDPLKGFFEEVDKEVDKSVKGIMNNMQVMKTNLKEICNQPSYKNLNATVELKKGKSGLEWKVRNDLNENLVGTANRLQQDLNAQLEINPKLQAANELFMNAVEGRIEEVQRKPTLKEKFNNFINRIKQFLGMDVKLENKQEVSVKQDRAAKRILGKFTEGVLKGSNPGIGQNIK